MRFSQQVLSLSSSIGVYGCELYSAVYGAHFGPETSDGHFDSRKKNEMVATRHISLARNNYTKTPKRSVDLLAGLSGHFLAERGRGITVLTV